MLSVSNLLCDVQAGNEKLRYGHRKPDGESQAVPRPVVVWALTKACNLKCVHCYASAAAEPAPGELCHSEALDVIDDLARFKVPAVLMSGGEPLMRPDIIPLIRYARYRGLACTLSTNGTLIDDSMADELAHVGLKYVGLSLDGTAATHDKLRGAKKAFERSVAAIDRCVERGIKVGVRFTAHALNIDDIDSIFDICAQHHVNRLCVYHLAYSGRGEGMQRVDLTPAQTRQMVDKIFAKCREFHAAGHPLEILTVDNHADAAYLLLQMERTDPQRAASVHERLAGTGGNRSGCNIAAIDPVGNVHYDQFSWHYSCGNVREEAFSSIWSSARDERLAILRNRRTYLPDRCQHCRFLDVCNGNLRTRAEAATGDWLGFDPGCYLTDEEIGVKHLACLPG